MTKPLLTRVGRTLRLVAILTLAALARPAAAQDATFTFGIVPQQSAGRLAQIWGPFVQEVGRRAGVGLRFVTTADIPTFEACLDKGIFDFAYMNPYHYVLFHQRAGYQAFAHASDETLEGLLVVRADSGLTRLEDLAGKEIAFPSPGALAASVIPRAELTKRGIAFRPSYVRSHDSVYRAVLAGLMPAGGGIRRTFENLADDQRAALRTVHVTASYTTHAFAARAQVPQATVAAVGRAMTTLGAANEALLEPLGMVGFVAAADAEWNDVRSLDLTPEETGVAVGNGTKCPFD